MQGMELYKLVHSMSSAEKRFFKMHSQSRSKPEELSYLRLFDLLNGQKSYDPLAIKNAFANEGYSKYLSWAQNNLFSLLLESERIYCHKKEVRYQLDAFLQDIRFLVQRKIFSKSEKLIKKALQMAKKYDQQQIVIELLEISRLLLMEQQQRGYEAKVLGINEEIKIFAERFNAKVLLENLYRELVLASRITTQMRKAKLEESFGALLESPLLRDRSALQSFYAIHFYDLIHATYYHLAGEFEQALSYHESLFQHWEENAVMIAADYNLYQRVLNNYLTGCQMTNRFDVFEEVLPKFFLSLAKSPNDAAEGFQNAYHHSLVHCLNTMQFEKALELVPEIESGLALHDEKINYARRLTFFHNISVLFFLCEDFENASKWNRKIIEQEGSKVRQDLREFSELLRLMICYEQKEFAYLESLLNSSKAFFRRRKKPFLLELLVIRQLERLRNSKKEDAVSHLNEFRVALEKASSENPRLSASNGFEEIDLWLESRQKGISILAVLKDRNG